MKNRKNRRNYTVSDVMRLAKRRNQKLPNPKYTDMSPKDFHRYMGELIAAGHMKFTRLEEMQVSTECVHPLFDASSKESIDTIYNLKFSSEVLEGERPHIKGYITPTKGLTLMLNGWINLDGTIRLEVVRK